MLQFPKPIDKPSAAFAFMDAKPNARPNTEDYCKQQRSRKHPQAAVDRGFFYVFANKLGTATVGDGRLCVSGNYGPVWTDWRFRYEVKGEWPERLWKRYQLSADQYEEYLVLSRDGVPARKRNLQAAREGADRLADLADMAANTKRIRNDPNLYKPFKPFPIIETWLRNFQADALRYAMVIVSGPSRMGKTELAKSWFRNPLAMKVGELLSSFPAKMRGFDRRLHDGIVLDDVRDLLFIENFQHVFQGKSDEECWFAETTGGTCTYSKLVFRVPFVATINKSTRNLEFLESHDYIANPANCIVLDLKEAPYEGEVGASGGEEGSQQDPSEPEASAGQLPVAPDAPQEVSPEAVMRSWSVADVVRFFAEKDMSSAAKAMQRNDVSGADLVAMGRSALESCNLQAFLVGKVLAVRDAYLNGTA